MDVMVYCCASLGILMMGIPGAKRQLYSSILGILSVSPLTIPGIPAISALPVSLALLLVSPVFQ